MEACELIPLEGDALLRELGLVLRNPIRQEEGGRNPIVGAPKGHLT